MANFAEAYLKQTTSHPMQKLYSLPWLAELGACWAYANFCLSLANLAQLFGQEFED